MTQSSQNFACKAKPTRTNETPCTKKNPAFTLRTSQRLLLHRLLKHLQRQRRLIIRHLVPGPKNPQEAEVVDGLERASLCALDRVRRQWCGLEGGCARVGDGVGGGETAKPVADPVGVAGPQDYANAALDDGGEGWEEVTGVWRKVVSWNLCRSGRERSHRRRWRRTCYRERLGTRCKLLWHR